MTSAYDLIPLECVGQNILDVGAGRQPILRSKLKSKVLQNNYQGIDISPLGRSYKVEKADIIDYPIRENYFDTIIMVEVLEHIHFQHWYPITHKLKYGLKNGGYLILTTPYKEKPSDFMYSIPKLLKMPAQIHTVFGINKKIMRHYFPNCQIKFISRLMFRQDNCSLIWAIGRLLKRIFFGPFPFKRNIMIIWKKNEKTT